MDTDWRQEMCQKSGLLVVLSFPFFLTFTITWQCPLLALSVHSLQMVWECVCVHIYVCMCTEWTWSMQYISISTYMSVHCVICQCYVHKQYISISTYMSVHSVICQCYVHKHMHPQTTWGQQNHVRAKCKSGFCWLLCLTTLSLTT